jgi:hypothetical protein
MSETTFLGATATRIVLHELLIINELFIGGIEFCNRRNDPRACTR